MPTLITITYTKTEHCGSLLYTSLPCRTKNLTPFTMKSGDKPYKPYVVQGQISLRLKLCNTEAQVTLTGLLLTRCFRTMQRMQQQIRALLSLLISKSQTELGLKKRHLAQIVSGISITRRYFTMLRRTIIQSDDASLKRKLCVTCLLILNNKDNIRATFRKMCCQLHFLFSLAISLLQRLRSHKTSNSKCI